jgi:hypothetical protein
MDLFIELRIAGLMDDLGSGSAIKASSGQAPCNLNYSGGRDQEDRGLKPGQENSSVRPYLKKTLH